MELQLCTSIQRKAICFLIPVCVSAFLCKLPNRHNGVDVTLWNMIAALFLLFWNVIFYYVFVYSTLEKGCCYRSPVSQWITVSEPP